MLTKTKIAVAAALILGSILGSVLAAATVRDCIKENIFTLPGNAITLPGT
jgi:hypothetical protein